MAALSPEGGVRIRCLGCGTIGPDRVSRGEVFAALLKIPYRASRSDVNSNCAVADRRIKGARIAFESRTAAVLLPLL